MFHVILFQPEIPPNTGNIIRLCANTGCSLHQADPPAFQESLGQPRVFAFTTKGSQPYHSVSYRRGDAFLFGPESRGLPQEIRDSLPAEQRLRLPMRPDCRSLNLSNTVAVAVYEAWRQLDFAME